MRLNNYWAVGVCCLSVGIAGCSSTASDLKFAPAAEAKKLNLADYTNEGRLYVLFNLKGEKLQIERIQTGISTDQLEAMKATNSRAQKEGAGQLWRDCVQVRQGSYATCFDMNVPNQKQYLYTSVFRRDALDGVRGVTGAIFAPLTMSLGVVSSVLSFDPKQAERAAQSTKQSTTRVELDVESLNRVGIYIEDQLAEQRRIAMQALNTQEVEGLRRYPEPLAQGIVSKGDVVRTYRTSLSDAAKVKYLNVLEAIHRNQSDSRYAEQLFFRATVNSMADVPAWANAMAVWGRSPAQYAEAIVGLNGFGARLGADNFVQSDEYKYALRYLRPKVSVFTSLQYGVEVQYPNKSFKFSQNADCRSEGKSYETASAGFFEGWLGNVRDRTNTYEKYQCVARSNTFQALEERLIGSVQATNKLSAPWKHFVLLSSQANRYEGTSSSGSSGGSSSTSSGAKFEIYKDKGQAASWAWFKREVVVKCLRGREKGGLPSVYLLPSGRWHTTYKGEHNTMSDAANAACD